MHKGTKAQICLPPAEALKTEYQLFNIATATGRGGLVMQKQFISQGVFIDENHIFAALF